MVFFGSGKFVVAFSSEVICEIGKLRVVLLCHSFALLPDQESRKNFIC
jgi:hypothetical protein